MKKRLRKFKYQTQVVMNTNMFLYNNIYIYYTINMYLCSNNMKDCQYHFMHKIFLFELSTLLEFCQVVVQTRANKGKYMQM